MKRKKWPIFVVIVLIVAAGALLMHFKALHDLSQLRKSVTSRVRLIDATSAITKDTSAIMSDSTQPGVNSSTVQSDCDQLSKDINNYQNIQFSSDIKKQDFDQYLTAARQQYQACQAAVSANLSLASLRVLSADNKATSDAGLKVSSDK